MSQDQQLHRLEITVDEENAELLTATLAMHVPHGWQEDILATGETRATVHNEEAPFLMELEHLVAAALPKARLSRSSVPNTDWVVAWKEFFTPVQAGSRFLVLAPWMEAEMAATDRTPIIIEPKTAFGTGHHATTALCLTALSDLLDEGRLGPGMRFLDLGTGSGILGIACAKSGLTGLGLDIELPAIANSKENAVLNGVTTDGETPAFQVARGSIEDAPERYDCILANILAQPLRQMAPAIVDRLAEGACLILSGLLGIQADAVADAYTACGLPKPQRVDNGEWSALVWK